MSLNGFPERLVVRFEEVDAVAQPGIGPQEGENDADRRDGQKDPCGELREMPQEHKRDPEWTEGQEREKLPREHSGEPAYHFALPCS